MHVGRRGAQVIDATERLARRHLVSRGFLDPVFEPDGNVPPDFLVEGRLAIEVRRLNQHERVGDRPRGLEELSIPYLHRLQSLLASHRVGASGTHWIGVRFKRPLPLWAQVEPGVRTFASALLAGDVAINAEEEIAPAFRLAYAHHTPAGPGRIEIGTVLDLDLGGMVVPEFDRNLRLCSRDKLRKVERVRDRYPEWWLLLVDTVGYGLSARDRREYLNAFEAPAGWDRIVIVSPLDPADYFDI